MGVGDVPNPIPQQPSVVIAADRNYASLLQQFTARVDATDPIGDVASAHDRINTFTREPFQRSRKSFMLAMHITNQTYTPERRGRFLVVRCLQRHEDNTIA